MNASPIPAVKTAVVALHEIELEEFERVMAVNVTGSYLMLKAAAERMIPLGVGRIVNTSSITAFDLSLIHI